MDLDYEKKIEEPCEVTKKACEWVWSCGCGAEACPYEGDMHCVKCYRERDWTRDEYVA